MNIIRIWKILEYFWENRRITLPVIFAFFLASVIYSVLLPNQYTSVAKFLPSGPGGGPMGFITGWLPTILQSTTAEGISSFLFPEILKSRSVIIEVAKEPFDSTLVSKTGKKNLQEFYNWTNESEIVDGFMGNSKVLYSFDKGIVTAEYTSKYPYLSYFVMKTWIDKLHWYLENKLETEAKRNYEYLTQRHKELKENLEASEDSLAIFIRTHRNYDSDPITNLEYQRLSATLQAKQNIYSYVSQQLENERLNMTKSLPTIKILDPPNIPKKKAGPKRSLIVILGILLGVIVSTTILVIRSSLLYLNKYRTNKTRYE